MTKLRPLVGPVSRRFADEHLGSVRRARSCLTFGQSGADIPFSPGESWSTLAARLPKETPPDLVLLNLPYTVLPTGIDRAEIPVIGVATDWPLLWHYYRQLATHLDCLWTDVRGTELLTAAGIANVRSVIPFGRPNAPPGPDPSSTRPIDLVWIGNFNPAIHRDRTGWVTRVSQLVEHYRVRIFPGLDPEKVRPLLGQARVAFLPGFHGAWESLVGEALSAGTAIVRETVGHEVPGGLEPGREFVPFTDADLEATLVGLLNDESRCRTVAAAGRARAAEFGTERLWQRAMATVVQEWDELRAAAQRRLARSPSDKEWELTHWQSLSARPMPPTESESAGSVGQRLAGAIAAAWSNGTQEVKGTALSRLRNLLSESEARVPAAIHLAELRAKSARQGEEIFGLREALDSRIEPSTLALGFGPLSPGFNPLRVEWERSGWENPADPAAEVSAKRILIRAQCDLLLGQATDDPTRVVHAARTAPQLQHAVQAAGSAAARIGKPADALPFLSHAMAVAPFDNDLAKKYEKALREIGSSNSLERFRRERRAIAVARSPASIQSVPASPRRQRVSLTMIVKNEETKLATCLDSVRGLVDEIVVVDTGSTDNTPTLAVARGARVVRSTWRDDFAAVRNDGIAAARGDWIFWLDADEHLSPADRDKAKHLFAGLRDENAAYMMRQLSSADDPSGATTAVDQVRLFRSRPDVRWEYRIHEQILLAIRRTSAAVRATDIVIAHTGYHTANIRDEKLRRNTRLLELAHREKPSDPILAFNLAWVYHKAGRSAEALPLLEHCRAVLPAQVSIVPKVYRLLGQVQGRLGRTKDALAAFTDGRARYPNDIELLLHHGLFLQRGKDYAAAEACFRRILALPSGSYPVGLDLGLRGYKTRHALAELYMEQGRPAEAEAEWRVALTEQPGFKPARDGMAAAALAGGKRQSVPAFAKAIPAAVQTVVNRPRRIVWEGGIFTAHSYCHVNRELCSRLIARGHEVSIHPADGSGAPFGPPVPPALHSCVGRPLSGPADVWVRHRWPPELAAPPEGRLVVMQPWEFGSLPQTWAAATREHATEVWVYSHAIRDCYVAAGVQPERVHVVPLGIDPERFHPAAAPIELKTRKRFKFLFVGGTIRRKGFDVLLAAYSRAFTSADDVCLVIKDLGNKSFYEGQTGERLVAEFRSRPTFPDLLYLPESLPADQMPGLYTACDCLVHPFRGEGFGLPIAEAMACGRPTIVTDASPATDYCTQETSYFVRALRREFAADRVGDLDTVARPWLHEPDQAALVAALRSVADDSKTARRKGVAAAEQIRSGWTWDIAVQTVEDRLAHLGG